MRPETASTSDLRLWVAELASQGLSAVTLRRKVQSLRSFYKFMMKRHGMKVNPAEDIVLPKQPVELPVYVKPSETEAMLNADFDDTDFVSVRDRLILDMFYTTGVRCSELLELKDAGKIGSLSGTILGKSAENGREPEYISPKKDNGLNEHIMVFGASGAGKSRGFVKPFILQCIKRQESLVLVDPKGEFFESMSELLKNKGYEVRSFNLLDMVNSDGWNVMADIETDRSLVQSMAEIIIRNTSNANERQDFWEKAEMNLFMALIHYVQGLKIPGTDKPLPIEERSLGAIYKMLAGDSFADIEQG